MKHENLHPGGPPSPENRPSWDEYFMDITRLVARRSTCLRRGVGALIVKNKKILATGYNGAPAGIRHCSETGCLREKRGVPSGERAELCRGLHAEQNAIIQAAFHGVSIAGAVLYSTTMPCSVCMKMIINAGIEGIIYEEGYPDQLAEELIQETQIPLRRYQGPER
jgi:dCMP deaminase